MIPKTEPVLPVAGFPAPILAEFLPGRMTAADALALTAAYHEYPENGMFRLIPEIAQFATRWKERAFIRVAEFCAGIEYFDSPTGRTLSARADGALAESRLCAIYGGTDEQIAALTETSAKLRLEAKEWFRGRGVPKMKPAPELPDREKELPPLEDILANTFATLYLSGDASEGFLVSICREYQEMRERHGLKFGFRGVTCRVELREQIDCAVHRGKAVAAWLKPYEPHARPGPKTQNLPREVACPVCLFGFYLYRSMGMECGLNIGSATCPACNTRVQVRGFRGDTPDAGGEALRAFRLDDAPG